jgi:CHAT domain-containing protein
VNDASTSRLMSDFYTRWVKAPGQGKAEALRQAQLALLHSAASSGEGTDERGLVITEKPGAAQSKAATAPHLAGYSHPFYWAPFVLIGNFQ